MPQMLPELKSSPVVHRWNGGEPLLAPETRYETDEGYRTNVIFPGGLIAEEDGTVKIYYGASDTVECMATAKLEDLIALCEPL